MIVRNDMTYSVVDVDLELEALHFYLGGEVVLNRPHTSICF